MRRSLARVDALVEAAQHPKIRMLAQKFEGLFNFIYLLKF